MVARQWIDPDLLNPPIVRVWLLRLLASPSCRERLIVGFTHDEDSVRAAIGLTGERSHLRSKEADDQLEGEILHLVAEVGESNGEPPAPEPLRSNIQRLGRATGLSTTERRILEFFLLLHTNSAMNAAFDAWLDMRDAARAARVLPKLLGLPATKVRDALRPTGRLHQAGLLSFTDDRDAWYAFLTSDFPHLMLTPRISMQHLLNAVARPAGISDLSLTDYAHVQPTLDVLLPYFRKRIREGASGVNAFIYGPPGTGKSELARVIARELGCEAYDLATGTNDGAPARADARLRAYRAAQHLLRPGRRLLIFDEAQDIFGDERPELDRRSTADAIKGWVNRALESNRLPTLWLSNSVADLDPAFVRRFDLVIELPIPPRPKRAQIIADTAGRMLRADAAERLAAVERLAPAVVARASAVVRSIADQLDPDERSPAVERLINATLEAQGHKGTVDRRRLDPVGYTIDFANASEDLRNLLWRLSPRSDARFCLYGPPGTGKTAYARHLADALGVPLTVKRASDLLSPWIGETEQNLARAFRNAERDGAILLIDEVDSFLQDRRRAQRSWEISQVNELLTQMENYQGIFVACTNLVEDIDRAALRRFDFKIRFDYLTARQTWQLFEHCREKLGLPAEPGLRTPARAIRNATPGDFAVVMRQHLFKRFAAANELLTALKEECAMKADNPKLAIGFA